MPKGKGKSIQAVTDAARQAGLQLAAWSAVEAHAQRLVAEAEKEEGSGNYAEFHFNGATVEGVVKAGQCVLKIRS